MARNIVFLVFLLIILLKHFFYLVPFFPYIKSTVYCPSEEMTADALTKPLGNILFLKHRLGMGLGSIISNNSDSVTHNQSD